MTKIEYAPNWPGKIHGTMHISQSNYQNSTDIFFISWYGHPEKYLNKDTTTIAIWKVKPNTI